MAQERLAGFARFRPIFLLLIRERKVSYFSQTRKRCSQVIEMAVDNLVDGMGFEPTTPTLRTWCSPS